MRSTVRILPSLAMLATLIATIPGTTNAQTAPKKPSLWQQMKDAAKQAGQPAGQPAQQPQPAGQKPAKPGQPAQPGAAQGNDTGPFTPPPGTKIDPVVMAPVEQGAQFAVSPHGIHVATLSHSGSRAVIIYDGVTGPKFDQLFMEGGGGASPVVFSPDGNRWACCGQQGNEWVVMVDGKELTRGKAGPSVQINAISCTLGFTSNSKHVYFTSFANAGAAGDFARFVFDGKPGPLGADTDLRNYAFSPDGNRYAYICYEPVPNSQRSRLIVDNQPVLYDAGSPQWSADSQHLYTMRVVRVADSRIGSAQEFLLDGKPFLRADQRHGTARCGGPSGFGPRGDRSNCISSGDEASSSTTDGGCQYCTEAAGRCTSNHGQSASYAGDGGEETPRSSGGKKAYSRSNTGCARCLAHNELFRAGTRYSAEIVAPGLPCPDTLCDSIEETIHAEISH